MVNRINRHAQKRKGIQIQKKRFCRMVDRYGNPKVVEDDYANEDGWWWTRHHRRNRGFEYWQRCYLSGARRYAKESTNGVIRTKYRNLLRPQNISANDDTVALRGADYEKEYDYLWTIW